MAQRHRVSGWILVFHFLAAGTAWAVSLSEAEFLALAAEQHRIAPLLDAPVQRAGAEIQRNSSWPNPVASVERESPGGGRTQLTWSLAWQPPLDPRRGLLRAAAGAGVDVAIQERAWSSLEWRTELRAVYADWALATERVAASEDLLERTRRLIALLEDQARIGEQSGLSVRRLRLAAIEQEAQAAGAAADLARTAEAASVWVAEPGEYEPSLPPLPDPPAADAASEHPLLVAGRAEVKRAEFLERASRRYLSFPELSVGLQQVREPGFETDGLVIGGRVPLPIFERGQADRMEARARLSTAHGRLDLDVAQWAARRAGAEAAYRRLRDAAVSSVGVIEESDDAIESATARFELGESDLTELLETLRAVLASRLASLELYAAALQAHRELELATGHVLEEEHR